VGCGSDDGAPSAATEATSSATEAIDQLGSSYDSVLELLDSKDLAEFDESERVLLELIVPPTAFDDGLRLAVVQVDDPNGNGRIDDRWYPPRVVLDECSIKTDQAPMPRAAASYVPGDPDEEPANQLEASQMLMQAPFTIGVTIQVFDTAEQRDGMADTMAEFYETVQGGDLDCGLSGLFGDVEQVEAFDAGHPGFGFVTEQMLGGAATTLFYSIGDRLLLTIGLSDGGPLAEDDAEGPADDLFERAVDAQVAWLEAAALPTG